MDVRRLEEFQGGWIAGAFNPTLLPSPHMEVAIKRYAGGTRERAHVHRVAQEITVVISGTIEMNGRTLGLNEIAILAPGEPGEFHAVTEAVICVIKAPSVPGDKYPL